MVHAVYLSKNLIDARLTGQLVFWWNICDDVRKCVHEYVNTTGSSHIYGMNSKMFVFSLKSNTIMSLIFSLRLNHFLKIMGTLAYSFGPIKL